LQDLVVHIYVSDGILALFFAAATLSPMHFTHTIQSSCGVIGSTLEIYYIKILELKGELKWPLKLYGMVSARDTVDRNRNLVFFQSSLDHQELDENVWHCIQFSLGFFFLLHAFVAYCN
jgi:hypothetical protein